MSGFETPAPTNTDWFNILFFYDPTANGGTGGGGSTTENVHYPVAQGLVSFPDGIELANDIVFVSTTATDNDIVGANSIECQGLTFTGVSGVQIEPYIASTDTYGIIDASNIWTGYNTFNNNSGINLINTTSTNSVSLGADATTSNLLTVNGNLKIGNGSLVATNIYSAAGSTTNSINMLATLSGNTGAKTGLGVYYNLNSTGEVDLVGMGNASGGGFSFYQSNSNQCNEYC